MTGYPSQPTDGQGQSLEATASVAVAEDGERWAGKAGSDSAPVELTTDTRRRIYQLAIEVARLVCVRDVPYVDDKEGRRELDLAANEIGVLLQLPEPEFANLWRGDDTLGRFPSATRDSGALPDSDVPGFPRV